MGSLQSRANIDSLSVGPPNLYARPMMERNDELGDGLYAQARKGQHDTRLPYWDNQHERETEEQKKLNGYLPTYHHNKDFAHMQHTMFDQNNFMDNRNVADVPLGRPAYFFDEEPDYNSPPTQRTSSAYERKVDRNVADARLARPLSLLIEEPNYYGRSPHQRSPAFKREHDRNVADARSPRPTSHFNQEPDYNSRSPHLRSPAYESELDVQKWLYNERTRKELGQMVFTPDIKSNEPEARTEKIKVNSNSRNFPEYHHDEEDPTTDLPPFRPAYMNELMARLHTSHPPRSPTQLRSPPRPRHDRDQSDQPVHYIRNKQNQRKTKYTSNGRETPSEHRYQSRSQHFSRQGETPPAARPTARPTARLQQEQHGVSSFNIGVAGSLGAGKSELIDAIRGVQRGDMSSARVPKSQSMHPFFFDDPAAEHIVLIEIPYPMPGTYKYFISDEKLDEKLQCLIIVIAGSIREEDIKFAMAAYHVHIPIVFIFSKCDIDLRSTADELSLLTPTEQCRHYRENGRRYFMHEIRRFAPELQRFPLFFVSAPVIREMWRKSQNDAYAKIPDFLLDERAAVDYFLEIIANVNGGNFFRG